MINLNLQLVHIYILDGITVAPNNSTDNRSVTSDADIENQQKIMRHLPEESKREIQKQIDVFKVINKLFFILSSI